MQREDYCAVNRTHPRSHTNLLISSPGFFPPTPILSMNNLYRPGRAVTDHIPLLTFLEHQCQLLCSPSGSPPVRSGKPEDPYVQNSWSVLSPPGGKAAKECLCPCQVGISLPHAACVILTRVTLINSSIRFWSKGKHEARASHTHSFTLQEPQ